MTPQAEMQTWTGVLPRSWRSKRLKWATALINDKTEETVLPYVGLENVESGTGRLLPAGDVIPEGLSNQFESGDVLFGKLRPYLAKVLKPEFPGRCTSELLVLRPKDLAPGFLKYVLLSDQFIKAVDSSTFGAKMPRAEWEFIGHLFIPVPPPAIQERIASFLDNKTVAIDELITKKERLIELLQEKRQALIAQVVTKGLDPNVPMKESGLPWCPQVPAHWNLPRNKELLRMIKTAVGERHFNYQLLSLTKRGVIVRDVDSHMGKHLVNQGANQEVREGDLVFCFFDVDETPRTVGLSRWLGMISPDYTILRCEDRLTAEFLEYFYISMDDRKLLRPLYSGLRKRISKPEFLSSAVPLPPTEERQAIVTHLRQVLARDELLLGKTAESVEKLKEYRQAIISAAVTGQLDLFREAA